MCVEASLCTPKKDISACVCATQAHSIDIYPRGGRASRGCHRGFVGFALHLQVELLSGHLACVPIGLCDGPTSCLGPLKV